MQKISKITFDYRALFMVLLIAGCSKNSTYQTPSPPTPPTPVPAALSIAKVQIGNLEISSSAATYKIGTTPSISFSFSTPVNRSTVDNAFLLKENSGSNVAVTISYLKADSVVVIQPQAAIKYLTKYNVSFSSTLKAVSGTSLANPQTLQFVTNIDSTDKFPRISDAALLDLVQKQTFSYFWDFGHPVSGLARERNTSGDLVTTGGSGFGIMSIVVGIDRKFITRTDGLDRLQKMVTFLKTKTDKFHGAFPHWLNGATGAVIPFSPKDNGADLVETSFLMEGLLTARQYFDAASTQETTLRNDINDLWNGVEWDWFRQNNQDVLYWHWSPNFTWDMNVRLQGWNEALVTYVLAAASATHTIPRQVYDAGWAYNGGLKNGNSYYGIQLPLGPPQGGPLFFEHYSFLGINPNGLADTYANYETQSKNHTRINYTYCANNPRGYFGYSTQCWGLTASDDWQDGYKAHSPENDNGVISPTAALSSMPYTPTESMNALKFFYYTMGDKLFKQYGFVDAFSLNDQWFADSYLAIDQGPEIVMIENYRSGLLWKLFTSCPEVKAGLVKLGFSAPYL